MQTFGPQSSQRDPQTRLCRRQSSPEGPCPGDDGHVAEPSPPGAKPQKKLSYKDARRLEEIERLMAEAPAAIAATEAKLADPDLYARDPAAFQRLTDELQALRDQVDAAETEWLELEEKKAELAG